MAEDLQLGWKLLEVVEAGDAIAVEELLRAGANPNVRELLSRVAALQTAACKGDLAIVELLVRYGADINLVSGDFPSTAIESAAIAGRTAVVRWLLENAAHVPEGHYGDELIEDVRKNGDVEIAALLKAARSCSS